MKRVTLTLTDQSGMEFDGELIVDEAGNEADAVLSLYETGTEIGPQVLSALPEHDREGLTRRVIHRYDFQMNSVLAQLEAIVPACRK